MKMRLLHARRKGRQIFAGLLAVLALAAGIGAVRAETAAPALKLRHQDWTGTKPAVCLYVNDVKFTQAETAAALTAGDLQAKILAQAKPALNYYPNSHGSSVTQPELVFQKVDVSAVKAEADATAGYSAYAIRFYMDPSLPNERWIDATLYVTANPKPVVKALEIRTAPTKTSYVEGETFDPAGMTVFAVDDSGKTTDVTSLCAIAPAGPLAAGTTQVKVSYEGATAVQSVTVTPAPPVLQKIEVTAQPQKLVYTEGETFDAAGMTVTAYYSDKSSKAVTQFTVSPAGALTPQDTAVVVHYTFGGVEKTVSVPISVQAKERQLARIAIEKAPGKMTYQPGENFDAAGMVVTGYYSDGTSAPLENYGILVDTPLKADSSHAVIYVGGQEARVYFYVIAPQAPEPAPEVPAPTPAQSAKPRPASSKAPAVSSSASSAPESEAPKQTEKPAEKPQSEPQCPQPASAAQSADTQPAQEPASCSVPLYAIMLLLSAVAAAVFAALLVPDLYVLRWYSRKKKAALHSHEHNTKGSK